MKHLSASRTRGAQSILLSVCSLAAMAGLSGCLVAGYSTQSGFWIWPGSIVLTLILIFVFLLSRWR